MNTLLICNAHLDPVWLWQWDEGVSEAISTFRAAAEFCEERDGFIFNHNESFLYEKIEEYAPELFLKIQELVRKKKWNIIGGWYLQPDCNVPSGESIVRQILRGRVYFKSKFGVNPRIAINFDSFGHSQGLVQVLKKAGYEMYIVCRPPHQHYAFDDADFMWEGYEGSQIVVHRSDENYNSVKGKLKEELTEWIASHKDEENTMFLWGVGNHGGGPSRKDLDGVEELLESGEKLVHSTPEEYLSALRREDKTLPLVTAGLNPVAEGCYTSQIRIKQLHNQLENDIYMVEKMASHAEIEGLCTYKGEDIEDALTDLMLAEFHDALPGSGNVSVEEDTIRQLHHGLEITSRLKTKYFFALSAGQERLKEGTVPLLLYNPHPFPVKTIVDCEFVLPQQRWEMNFSVPKVFRGGNPVPSQYAKEESNFNMDWRKRVVFEAEIPAASMGRYDVEFEVQPYRPVPALKSDIEVIRVQAGGMTVVVNKKTGLVDSYNIEGKEYLKPSSLKPQVFFDKCGAWGGFFDKRQDPEADFRIMTVEEATEFSGVKGSEIEAVRVIEDGPVRTVVEALLIYKHSQICQRYNILKESQSIELEMIVFWNEKEKRLKLSIPTTVSEGDYIGQTMFGQEKLSTRTGEVVSQKWSGVFGKEDAVTVINTGTPGSDFYAGEIRMTLLRSAGYSASEDGMLGEPYHEQMYMPRMDLGKREFKFLITAGNVEKRMEEIEREAAVYNQKPYCLAYCPDGNGKKPQSLIEISSPNVQLSCFKKHAQREFAYIIRVYESVGKKTAFEMKIPSFGIETQLEVGPYEIKTYVLDKNNGMRETDLLEGLCD